MMKEFNELKIPNYEVRYIELKCASKYMMI